MSYSSTMSEIETETHTYLVTSSSLLIVCMQQTKTRCNVKDCLIEIIHIPIDIIQI